MSQIKGGGRATLSEANEESLVDFLMKRRGCWPSDSVSEHDLRRDRKRFVKKLVEEHERRRLAQQFNANANANAAAPVQVEAAVSVSGKTSRPAASFTDTTGRSTSSNVTTENPTTSKPSGKVRVELVEAIAIYQSKAKKKSDDGDRKTKPKKRKLPFKEGTRKVLVLPRSTTVDEIVALGQNKLHLKKKPVRVFVVDASLELDLLGDLAGVENDTILYISVTSKAPDKETNQTSDRRAPRSSQTIQEQTGNKSDPLQAVKRAYTERGRQLRNRPKAISTATPSQHPSFVEHFDKLPPLSEARSELPAARCREDILRAVQDHRVVVICGATGCGKSTQVPQFLWEGLQASSTRANIIVTQPRRVAATALAQRVSDEMGCPFPGRPGSLVGHHVRLDRAVAESARIVYCTVGILLRRMISPRNLNSTSSEDESAKNWKPSHLIPLSDVTHVVVDEVHERDVNTDFLLTLLRAALRQNPHVRIILMSATASAQLFIDYFAIGSGETPMVLSIPGRNFPVETKWLEGCQYMASTRIQNFHEHLSTNVEDRTYQQTEGMPKLSPRATDKIDYVFCKNLVGSIIRQQQTNGELSSRITDAAFRASGAILIFLPGKAEIEALYRLLSVENDGSLPTEEVMTVYKLHSGISRRSQGVVFAPVAPGTVKVILSTNIAETSITIPDVSHVIDTGRVKESRFNPSSRIKELVTVWTSRASAQQRAGRAGRTSAGVCYRLYSENFWQVHLPEQTTPEMLRTPLDELILQVCLLYEQRRDEQLSLDHFPKGASPMKFLSNVPEPPRDSNIQEACKHLLEVDALQVVWYDTVSLYRLTPLGFHLSRLPMDAKVGKILIVGCILECLEGALTVAATLSCSKSFFFHKWGELASDPNYKAAAKSREVLIERGFGGKGWKDGTVKGDLIAAIACYREWAKRRTEKERAVFARTNALDHLAMKEIQGLRRQYFELVVDAGFMKEGSQDTGTSIQNQFQDDALLTSCCLVAGLYPNVCTLMRPRKGGPKGGRLLTKDGDACRPQTQSFLRSRVQQASETGKDAYAMYHNKHRSLGTGDRVAGEVFLCEVNFVSRYALLLFCGELTIVKNAIIVDGWVKFKIGDNPRANAVLLLALREELDKTLIAQICGGVQGDQDANYSEGATDLMHVVRKLLAEE